jgi:hypothetical protein
VFGPDDVLWGSAPGQGPELRNAVESVTGHANRSWPGIWFFGFVLLLAFVFVAWGLISPRSFRKFSEGREPVFSRTTAWYPHRHLKVNVLPSPLFQAEGKLPSANTH